MPPRRPLIGISAEGRVAAWEAFAEIVAHYGGEPELLTPDSVSPLFSFSALLLLGGGDIHPSFFKQTLQGELRSLSLERDRFEFQLYRQARERGFPILGICRGMQVMAVGAGGSLYQQLPQAPLHDKTPYGDAGHLIEVKPGSQLARLIGGGAKFVNSAHHQATLHLGAEMMVSAVASDGTIEAVEVLSRDFLLGVQWHPERMWQYCPEQKLLVEAIVEKARDFDVQR